MSASQHVAGAQEVVARVTMGVFCDPPFLVLLVTIIVTRMERLRGMERAWLPTPSWLPPRLTHLLSETQSGPQSL